MPGEILYLNMGVHNYSPLKENIVYKKVSFTNIIKYLLLYPIYGNVSLLKIKIYYYEAEL